MPFAVLRVMESGLGNFFLDTGGLDAFATLTELSAVVRLEEEVSDLLAIVCTFGVGCSGASVAWGKLFPWVFGAFLTF